MVAFEVYDLIFLGLFLIFVIVFLSIRRKNLKREGIIFLYKTKLGIEFIDWFSRFFKKPLMVIQYVVLLSGFGLMIGILWALSRSTYLYLTTSIAQLIRAPPVFPVIPYFPKIFGLESFFPPLYFTYFIVALGIIAVIHEFAHGIFARLYNVKIHSTGFAFLGPILGAFVEPDEKSMKKISKFKQMVVLAAGTFANVLVALFFTLIIAIFFTSTFVPAGIKFSSYGIAELPMTEITFIGNSTIEGYVELSAKDKTYFLENKNWDISVQKRPEKIFVYEDTPAFRSQMVGAIIEIDGKKTRSLEELRYALQQHNVGDEVTVKTAVLKPGQGAVAETRTYSLNLTSNAEGRAALGIVFLQNNAGGFSGWIYKTFSKIKDPFIHYDCAWGDFGWFIYYLLWWIIVLNLLVALFNMMPLGILDGGRFFYLAVWGITRKEKIGRWAYKIMMWFILALIVTMMVRWVLTFT